MLSLRDVHVHIGKLHILQGVNLEVKPGESAALLGRNGVGKTTTLRAIMGLVPQERRHDRVRRLRSGATARRMKFRARASATSRRGAAFSPICRCWKISISAFPASATPSARTMCSAAFRASRSG